MTPKFWLVWKQASAQVIVTHDTKEIAIDEAECISALHPGQKFFVLEAVACVEGIVQIHRETL